jgi:hypothetical protein
MGNSWENKTQMTVYMEKSSENPTTNEGLHGKFMGNPTKIDVHMGNSWENHTKIEVYMVKSWENPTTNEGLHGKIMGKPSDKKRFTWEIQGKPNKNRCLHEDETGSTLARYRIAAPKSLPDLPLG